MRVLRDWLLTPQRVAIHLPTATAVAADLHLGYGQARCRSGEAVPEVSLEDTLSPLAALAFFHPVRRLVIAGDLFEDGCRPDLVLGLLKWLASAGLELGGVVPGNHDRGLEGVVSLPLFPDGIELGDWRVVHGHGRLASGRMVLGHFHPSLSWRDRLTTPCYLVGPGRLVLPAFSADAAGVNVRREARWQTYRCCAIGGDRVLDFGPLGSLAHSREKPKKRRG